MSSDDDKPHLQVAGYKIVLGAPGQDPPDPERWNEVLSRINRSLLSMTVGIFDLLANIIKSANRLVKGVGQFPQSLNNALDSRGLRQVEAADALEVKKQLALASQVPPTTAKTLHDLGTILKNVQVQGYMVVVSEIGGRPVIAMVPPGMEEELVSAVEGIIVQEPAMLTEGEGPGVQVGEQG